VEHRHVHLESGSARVQDRHGRHESARPRLLVGEEEQAEVPRQGDRMAWLTVACIVLLAGALVQLFSRVVVCIITLVYYEWFKR
jgi:hypothetical protein